MRASAGYECGRLFLLCLGDTPSGSVSYAAAILLWFKDYREILYINNNI